MSKHRDTEWLEAKQRCRLNEEEIRMAKELGMSPRSLIKNIPNKSQPWKAPVKEWIRGLHETRFGPPARERTKPPETSASKAPEFPPDAPNELELAREELFRKLAGDELDEDLFNIEMNEIEHATPVSGGEINDENQGLRKRYDSFRRFADLFAQEASKLDFVQRIVLFGSVAAPLKKEVPRFRRFRRAGIAVWHECKDVDLLVWLTDLTRLRQLKRAINNAVTRWQTIAQEALLPNVPHHAVDIFIMEPRTNRYRGNLCYFAQCPKDKPDCEVAGCGAQPFLRLHEDFKFDRFAPYGEHAVTLFDRSPLAPTPDDDDVPF